MSTQTTLHAPHALLPGGWARDVRLAWDRSGVLIEVRPLASRDGAAIASGPVVAGMPNLHSHAFQRAFAGLTEYRAAVGATDSFWTWRDLMYRFALAVSPDQLETIATQLYVEMLRCGYTSVCEFHYLHHDPAGKAYAEPAEMALRLARAASHAGIGLTLLPVLYQHAGFGGTPPRVDQRRFINSVDTLLEIAQRCAAQGVRVGVAPHSLRAVTPDSLHAVLEGVRDIATDAPVHVHIAEQQGEVDECLTWSGARPVQWLLDHVAVDDRWCLVHATHMTADESRRAAASGAVAGLCPSTEANLGDGVFDAPAYWEACGYWGIGSDSHASVSVVDELRLLEYSQRWQQRRRNVLARTERPQVAEALWLEAAAGGARAAGRPIGALEVGRCADFVVLETGGAHAALTPSQLLGSAVFATTGQRVVRDVWVGGEQRIADGSHALDASALAGFVSARRQLLEQV